MSDIPASDKPRQKDQARITHRPGAVQITPAWPAAEPDPQFDPGTARPVEMSEKDNDKDNPTNGITEETVATPAADRDTTPVDDAAVPEDSTPLTTYDAEEHQEEPQAGAPTTTQDDAPANASTEPAINDDAQADATGEKLISEAKVAPAAVSETNETQAAHDIPVMEEEKELETGAPELTTTTNSELPHPTNAPSLHGLNHVSPAGIPGHRGDKTYVDATGGPWLQVDAPQNMFDYQNQPLSLEKAKSLDAISLYISTTGGPGMPGTLASAETEGLDFNGVRQSFRHRLHGQSPENQIHIAQQAWDSLLPEIVRNRETEVTCAIIVGDMAIVMKESLPHGEWVPFARKNFLKYDIRTIQDYMRIASIRMIENHRARGITMLVKLAPIASKPPFSNADDPLQMIFETAQAADGYVITDHDILANLAIANHRLKKGNIFVTPALLRKFIMAKYTIGARDVKEMAEMVNPDDFIRDTMNNAGRRVFVHTKSQVKGKKDQTEGTLDLPNISSMFVKTSETIFLAIETGALTSSEFDRTVYEKLKSALQAFEETFLRS